MNAAKAGAKFLHGLSGFYDAESKVGKEMYQRCKMTAIEASDKVCCPEDALVFDASKKTYVHDQSRYAG